MYGGMGFGIFGEYRFDDRGLGIAAQRVLEEECQLRVAVVDVPLPIHQGVDHLPTKKT